MKNLRRAKEIEMRNRMIAITQEKLSEIQEKKIKDLTLYSIDGLNFLHREAAENYVWKRYAPKDL